MSSVARFVTLIALGALVAMAGDSGAGAEEPAAAPSARPAGDAESKDKAEASRRKKPAAAETKARGRRPREKEAEGSEAADRFEANTVIKSRYQLNGESLEVDPD